MIILKTMSAGMGLGVVRTVIPLFPGDLFLDESEQKVGC